MASGQDKNDSKAPSSNTVDEPEVSAKRSVPADEADNVVELPVLSPRARAIKRQIEEGTYRVDLPSLAESLLPELESPSAAEQAHLMPEPQNDQEPRED